MADDQTDQQTDDTQDVDQTADATGTDADDADDADDQDGDQDDADKGADQLGDAGKKALDAMKAKWRAERDRARDLERKLADASKPPAKADDAPDPEQIRAETRREVQAEANARIVRSEVKAAAAGKLADPADAHRFLDLTKFEVDIDGNVDQDELNDAIDELLKNKPYLAVAQGPQRRFQGSADSGARKEKPKTLNDRIAEAEASGDRKAVMRLKSAQALAVTNHQ